MSGFATGHPNPPFTLTLMQADAAAYTLALCARIAALTDVPNTITRPFLSPATAQVQALLRTEMQSLGMTVRTDSIGNLRGLYPALPCPIHRSNTAMSGSIPEAPTSEAPTLLLGSHIDTVPNAGPYDGILGVALPLALLHSLEGARLPFNIELIAFSEEEGIRFKLPFIGSRALTGTLTPQDLQREDDAGITIQQALEDFGVPHYNPHDCAPTPNTFAFLELHIEQGPVLESLSLPLGIVSSAVGQSRYQITFKGQSNHAGTTPMHLRRDALAAAAVFTLAVERYARRAAPLVATVGIFEIAPGAANIIPGFATLSLDLRHPHDNTRLAAIEELLNEAIQIAQSRGLLVTAAKRSDQNSVAMNLALQQALMSAAEATGHPAHSMPSGAGHDAMILAPHLPSAMLFLRTPAGLSHHPDESVSAADIQAALETTLHLLRHLTPALIHPR